MLVQSAFFAAYFFSSLPGAAIVRRIGYMRSAVVGLLVMTAGCLLFVPASKSGLFLVFLVALFVLASGITIVQVVANPLISMLGPSRTTHSRLTFAQAHQDEFVKIESAFFEAQLCSQLLDAAPRRSKMTEKDFYCLKLIDLRYRFARESL